MLAWMRGVMFRGRSRMKVSLFSIDPLGRGGAFTSALAVYTMLREWGLDHTSGILTRDYQRV